MIPASLFKIRAEGLLRGGLWTVLVAVISFTRTDPDLWGHVRFGLDILRDQHIPSVDPYSFTSDREWVNHEWASESLMGWAFAVGGNAGLVALKVGIVLLCCFLLCRMLRREGVDNTLACDAIGGVAVITTMEQAHHIRPQLFSLLCFAALLWCLMEFTRTGNRRWLVALPLLFAAWANCHGGWILGGAVLGLFTMGLAMGSSRKAAVWLLAAGAASLLATLATPYGVGLWTFLGQTVGIGRADIREWQPIYALGPRMWILWLATLGLALVGLAKTARKDIRPERLLVVAALALLSLQVSRLLAFFALSTLFLFGAAIASRVRLRASSSADRGRRLHVAPIAAAGVLTMAIAIPVIALNAAGIRIDSRHVPEPGAAEFLRTRAGTGRVLVWFDWGQYAIWHLPAGMQVSIDGRRETVYSATLHNRHLLFYFDMGQGGALPRELAADYVWLPRWLPATRKLKARDEWALVYEGEQSAIFERAGSRRSAVLVAEGTIPPHRNFPGP
jgi:hypothetical protein